MNEKRLAHLSQMLEADPDDPFLRYAMALEHLNGGGFEGACSRFKELAEARPDYVPTYYQYAMALVQMGDLETAVPVLEKGIKVAYAAGEIRTVNELEMLLEDLED